MIDNENYRAERQKRNRELVFRGKTVCDGDWVYGGITWNPSRKKFFIHTDWEEAKVIPETVGQYTGLTDKNGRRIFEGDIVRFIDIDFDGSERKAVGVIAWNRKAANFDIVKGTYRLDFHYPVFEEIEVIGNIYDNPELMENSK